MSIDTQQFRVHIIRPTLAQLADESSLPLHGERAENLLLATAAQESHMGRWLDQKTGPVDLPGPAFGIFQMEARTYEDVLRRTKDRFPKLRDAIDRLRIWRYPSRGVPAEEMIGNLPLAVGMARALYWLQPRPLPAAWDIGATWAEYKLAWNSLLGAATEDQFRENYRKFVA